MSQRSDKRALVWNEMKSLEDSGLGIRQTVSEHRDKFMLDLNHESAYKLSIRPEANGFIRADADTLLFRDASNELRQMLTQPQDLSFPSEKGVEFRWSDVDDAALHRIFKQVSSLATDSSGRNAS
jgi:hypothetical protein